MGLLLCTLIYFYGILSSSWRGFKLLKVQSREERFEKDRTGEKEKSVQEIRQEILTEEERKAELTSLLSFWVIFALLFLYDSYIEAVFCPWNWFPFYSSLKFFWLIWMVIPDLNGPRIMYQRIIRPRFKTHEHFIDNTILPTVSAGVRTGLMGFERFTFSLVSVKFLTVQEIDRLSLEYEERLSHLRDERQFRLAKESLKAAEALQDASTLNETSGQSVPAQESKPRKSVQEEKNQESKQQDSLEETQRLGYLRWAYDALHSDLARRAAGTTGMMGPARESKETDYEYRRTGSDQPTVEESADFRTNGPGPEAAEPSYAVQGLVGLARDTSQRIRRNPGSSPNQSERKEDLAQSESKQTESDLSSHPVLVSTPSAPPLDQDSSRDELKLMKEEILAGKYDAGFETLLDEFDDSPSEQSQQHELTSDGEPAYLRPFSETHRRKQGRRSSAETEGSPMNTDDDDLSFEPVGSKMEREAEVGVRFEEAEDRDIGACSLRYRGKVQRMSLHKPKRAAETSETHARMARKRDKIITRSMRRGE